MTGYKFNPNDRWKEMENAIYSGYQAIYHAIQDNMQDVNVLRASTKGRFVYPTYPTDLDNDYPRIAVTLTSLELTPVGDSNVIDFSGAVRKYGMQFNMGFTIAIFLKKETEYPIQIDTNTVKAKNDLLCEYLRNEAHMTLFKQILLNYFKNIGFWHYSIKELQSAASTWEYDTSRIVTEVTLKLHAIQHMDIIFPAEKLINDFNISMQVNH